MKLRFFSLLFLSFIICSLPPSGAWAACDGADMTGANNCVYFTGFGVVGDAMAGDNYDLVRANMYPFQRRLPQSDLAYWYDRSKDMYNDGYQYWEDLSLLDLSFDPDNPPASPTPQQSMILNPQLNYETAGLLDNFDQIEADLLTARDTFAYAYYVNYDPGDGVTPQTRLLESIKLLANIYLMVADEFLIDALEFRFSATSLMAAEKLDEQLALLEKARIYYQKAVDSFVYGFSPAVGTNIFVSGLFDDNVFDLFILSTERMSMSQREMASKQLARLISPDPLDTAAAIAASGDTLKESCVSTYLLAAATAQTTGNDFITYGGERLINALNTLRNQGNIYKGDLNPLGYDDRYIPMQDFTTLYNIALSRKNTASTSQNTLTNSIRDFDADAEKMRAAINALVTNPGGYKAQLASLTGVSVSDPDFINKVIAAGEDLYDCPIDDPEFSECVATKTAGVLGAKYSQIREAELRVQIALKKKDNLLDMVEVENQAHDQMLEIENINDTAIRDALENYLHDLKNARTIEKQKVKTKHGKTEKQTITSYYVENPQLELSTDKEVALQEAQKNYRIATLNLETGKTIKNLLNQIAETEIEIGLAIQAKNSAVMDFDNALKEKENVLYLYEKSMAQLAYDINIYQEKMPEVRILRCQSAIDLARDLNNAVHYAYLAAKAIEYQYMKPLVNLTVLNETLNIHDLYKVQTVEDLTLFLDKLNAYNACPWGSMAETKITISLAKNILGLTDAYLNPDNVLTPVQVVKLRTQKLQAFLSSKIDKTDNSLNFDFATALTDNYILQFNKYNMKIWYGTLSAPCDPVPAKGVSVRFNTTQTQSITPYVRLTQKGHSTYFDSDKNILEYVPVGEYLNMLSDNQDSLLATVGQFTAYVNKDPAADPLWDPSFKGRSVASSDWSMRISDIGDYAIDWSKVTDLYIYMDTINSNFLTLDRSGRLVPEPAGEIEIFDHDEALEYFLTGKIL